MNAKEHVDPETDGLKGCTSTINFNNIGSVAS